MPAWGFCSSFLYVWTIFELDGCGLSADYGAAVILSWRLDGWFGWYEGQPVDEGRWLFSSCSASVVPNSLSLVTVLQSPLSGKGNEIPAAFFRFNLIFFSSKEAAKDGKESLRSICEQYFQKNCLRILEGSCWDRQECWKAAPPSPLSALTNKMILK